MCICVFLCACLADTITLPTRAKVATQPSSTQTLTRPSNASSTNGATTSAFVVPFQAWSPRPSPFPRPFSFSTLSLFAADLVTLENTKQTPESAYVLENNKLGWFGQTGIHDVMAVANAPYKTSMKFEDMFVCDPSAEHYGYKSWDGKHFQPLFSLGLFCSPFPPSSSSPLISFWPRSGGRASSAKARNRAFERPAFLQHADFFTRQVHDKARPVASPEDDSVIANACESKVYNIEHHVKLRDRFYAKGQPYSVLDMLAHDPLAHKFVGGTIYQAFLSALSYHRWHSPVSGTVRRAFVQDGTYFSEPLGENAADTGSVSINAEGIGQAQGYLSALAARAIIVIEADNKDIGLVGFVGIGMDEVSTCDITVKEGQHIKKGEQTGMFHFGGSSHCLLFQKGVKLEGFPEVGRQENVPVRSKLVVVKK